MLDGAERSAAARGDRCVGAANNSRLLLAQTFRAADAAALLWPM